jgi:hypothetical protein
MDRDGDGSVTRDEWRGSPRSFEVHDWNEDGQLSGAEVRIGDWQDTGLEEADHDPSKAERFLAFTSAGFDALDHNRDRRVTANEWHFDRETFFRVDWDRDGALDRTEFLGANVDDDRGDQFEYLDTNGNSRIERAEWHASADAFEWLDRNHDGFLSRVEVTGNDNASPDDPFGSLDYDRDGTISRTEWHWSAGSFDRLDRNRNGRLTPDEFSHAGPQAGRSSAYQAGYARGLIEGRAAGRGDRAGKNGWDLEGQRELEQADSGFQAAMGPRKDYQEGYRAAFRIGYREAFGPR